MSKIAGMENAGVEKAGVDSRGGKSQRYQLEETGLMLDGKLRCTSSVITDGFYPGIHLCGVKDGRSHRGRTFFHLWSFVSSPSIWGVV